MLADIKHQEKLLILKNTSYTFVKRHIQPLAKQIDSSNEFPRELWEIMGSNGLLGITAPKEYGGASLDYFSHCIVMQAISYASGAVGLSYAAHSNLCINQVTQHGNISQKKKYLPDLITGKKVGALAISESNAGSDALALSLSATKSKNGFILNGRKMWITNGPTADIIVVYARTSISERRTAGITAFIVTSDMKGLIKMPKIDKMGMRGSDTCELLFKNVEVPEENILGDIDNGKSLLFSGLDCERVILAAGPIGLMERALELASSYAAKRKQFGKPIGTFQLIQAKLADMYTSYHSAKAYLDITATLLDNEQCKTEQAASVILLAAENATKVCLDAMQILGGNGYTNEFDVSRLLRDSKLYEIGAGTSEIRRLIIGRRIYEYHN